MDQETRELPVEPPVTAGATNGTTEKGGPGPGHNFEELMAFHLYGRQSAEASAEAAGPRPIPALTGAYRDLSRIRHDYPIVVNERDAAGICRPLRQVVDDIVAAAGGEGDAGEQFKRIVYRVESAIKSLAEEGRGERLSALWDRAAEQLLSTGGMSKEKKSLLTQGLATARETLRTDGDVIPCSEQAPERLFTAVMVGQWRDRCAGWRPELEAIVCRLENILDADFSGSAEARQPEHLRESLGTPADELDVRAMSTILSTSRQGSPLPDARRERIRTVLSTLRRVKPVFDPEGSTPGAGSLPPFQFSEVAATCSDARERYESRLSIMTEFFKSVRIARLEVNNRYRESRHDRFFEEFSLRHLADDEWALCPPILMHLTSAKLSEADAGALMELLNSSMPVKILFQVGELCTVDGGAGSTAIKRGWPGRLAVMAMALGDVYVFQAPVSRPGLLSSGFAAGLRYPGPALFSVYTGVRGTSRRVPTYLDAEAAVESRVFPVLSFDPAGGTTLAEQVSILDNPQSEQPWPTEPFHYRRADGQEAEEELAFTPADFLYCDGRLADHFWNVPNEKWDENMVPLTEYLNLSPEDAESKIPYIMAVDRDGRLVRSVLTRAVLAYVTRCAASWRQLQESGGIHNSFAVNLLAAEKEQLAEEHRRHVEEIEQDYIAQLDQDLGELTREIVRRIAGQLIAEQGNGSGAAVSLMAVRTAPAADRVAAASAGPAAEVPEAAPKTEPVEDGDDDDDMSLDGAYVDTPLCTSCNECTGLNASIFAYDDNKQAFIKDAAGGPYRDLVRAAELCPVHVIHPGKPMSMDEAGIEEWIKRATPFN